jgi:hypothetical protein
MRQQRLFLYYDFKSCAIQPVEATLGDGQAIVLFQANQASPAWFRHATRRRKLRANLVSHSSQRLRAPQRIAVRFMFAQLDFAAIDFIDCASTKVYKGARVSGFNR